MFSELRVEYLVDLSHKSCTMQQKCQILNCPFGQFAPSYPYTCVNVGGLQNAERVTDPEVIQKKVFTSGYEVRVLRCLGHIFCDFLIQSRTL